MMRTQFWHILLVIFAIMGCSQSAIAQDKNNTIILDIDKAITMALKLNPNLKISMAEEEKADAQIRETAAGALPQLTFSGSYTRNIKKPVFFFKLGGEVQPIEIGSNNSYVANINLRQTIFDNGQLGVRKARRIANLFSQSTKEGTELTKDEVILNVRSSFYTVLLTEEVVEVFKASLEQAEAHYENIKQKYEKGAAAEFDLLRAEVQVAEIEPSLIEAQNNLILSKDQLKNAIGLDLEKKLELQGSLEYKPLSEVEIANESANALNRRPELTQLKLQRRMAELNIDIQKGQRLPSLFLNGNYQFQGESDDLRFGNRERSSSFAASIDLQFNIFDGFRTSARIQEARAEFNRIQHHMERVKQAVRIEVQQAESRINEARQRIQAQQKSVRQAEKAYQIAEVRYNNGVGTQLELFDARVSLNRIKTNYLQAVYDYNIALFEWQKAVGLIQENAE